MPPLWMRKEQVDCPDPPCAQGVQSGLATFNTYSIKCTELGFAVGLREQRAAVLASVSMAERVSVLLAEQGG
eukprot:gene1002-26562_t